MTVHTYMKKKKIIKKNRTNRNNGLKSNYSLDIYNHTPSKQEYSSNKWVSLLPFSAQE